MTSTEPPGAGSASAAEEVNALTQIYCGGPILAAVQRARIWPDSKDFLDTPTRARPSEVLAAWEASPPRDDDETRAFVAEWFAPGPPDPATLPRPSLPDWDPRGPPFARERFAEWIRSPRRRRHRRLRSRLLRQGAQPLATPRARAHRERAGRAHVHPHPHPARRRRSRRAFPRDVLLGFLLDRRRPPRQRHARNRRGRRAKHALPRRTTRLHAERRATILSQPIATARVSRRGSKGVRSLRREGDAARLRRESPPEPSEDASDSDADDPNRPSSLAGSEPPEVEIPMSDATRLARDALPTLVREHAYWSRPEKIVRVSTNRRDARNAVVGEYADLSRYWAYTDQPRPESWREDVSLAEEAGVADDPAARARLWRDVASAAESGHDFGSRWLAESGADVRGAGPGLWKPAPKPCSLATIRTTRVVPADLNGFMLKMEEDIAASARRTRDDAAARGAGARPRTPRTSRRGCRRRRSKTRGDEPRAVGRVVESVARRAPGRARLRSRARGHVRVVPIVGFRRRRARVRLRPACGALAPESKRAVAALAALQMSGLVLPGGIATSLRFTGHQWDYPNAWAPLVHVVVEGCREYCGEPGRRFAREIARRWLKGNAQLLKKTGHMHEKYDARSVGSKPGDGGSTRRNEGSDGVTASLSLSRAREVTTARAGDARQGRRSTRSAASVGDSSSVSERSFANLAIRSRYGRMGSEGGGAALAGESRC